MVLYLWRQMLREGNHFLINDELHSKIAFLTAIDKDRRQFVASSKFKNEAPFLMEQIICQKKAALQVPFMYERKCFYTQKAIMQATHHKVAEWKANYIRSSTKSDQIISLTAGLGVDDYFLAKQFSKVISMDTDLTLHSIALYNNKNLNIQNIERHHTTCQEYLAQNAIKNAVVYIDPDRKTLQDSSNRNVVLFSPNILEIAPDLLENNTPIFLKLSGVTDLDWIRANIPNVKEIHIISLKKEVKEILVVLNPEVKKHSNEVFVTELHEDRSAQTYNEKQLCSIKELISQGKAATNYIYQPSNGIIKSNLLRDPALCISPNTHFFYTQNTELSEFGQLYHIDEKLNMSLKQLKKHLKNLGISHASVLTRNCSLNSIDAKKFLQMKEDRQCAILIFGKGKTNDIYLTSRV